MSRLPLLALVYALLLPLSVQALETHVVDRAWQPSVILMGGGQKDLAVKNMKDSLALQEKFFLNPYIDPETERFIDGLWSSLERFNLKRFYRLLPEEKATWRELNFYGAPKGDQYVVGPDVAILGDDHMQNDFGELSAKVKASPIKKTNSFLLSSELNFGLGDIPWPQVVQSNQEFFELVTNGDASFLSMNNMSLDYRYVASVRQMNPDLSEEDIAVLAPIWAAFPQSWNMLASVGRVQDVVVTTLDDQPYKKMRSAFQLKPHLLQKKYPHLAKHISKLNELLVVKTTISNDLGELLTFSISSKDMTVSIEAYVQDGVLLPVANGKPIVGSQEIVADKQQRVFYAKTDLILDILGVTTEINDVKGVINYTENGDNAYLKMQMTQIPTVKIRGAALGIVPKGLINALMPGSIEALTLDLWETAIKGNNGQGIVAEMNFIHNEDQLTQLQLNAQFEALDNFMIRTGVAIVNDRIIPSEAVTNDFRALISDTFKAFGDDLQDYALLASNP